MRPQVQPSFLDSSTRRGCRETKESKENADRYLHRSRLQNVSSDASMIIIAARSEDMSIALFLLN